MTYINEGDFKKLWNNAIISLDTSALLFIQECDFELAKYVMDTLLFVSERIWIPFHVAKVEMNIKYKVQRTGAIGRLQKFNKRLDDSLGNINKNLNKMSRELKEEGHDQLAEVIADIDVNKFMYEMITNFKQKLDQSTEDNRLFLKSELVKTFQDYVRSKTHPSFTVKEIAQIKVDGIRRFEKKIPPGYCDYLEKEDNKFGDLIVWKELLKKSVSDSRPILFITRDKKEDWFHKNSDHEITSVREELIQEAKAYNAQVHIIYFNDFIRMSDSVVSRNIEDLINKLETEDSLLEQIEGYLNENMYGALQEELTDIGRSEYNSDFIEMDVIESIKILEKSYEVLGDNVIMNCRVSFQASLTHNYHVDSREPYIELPGSMDCEVDAIFNYDVFSGEHNEHIKIIDFRSIEIEFENIELIGSTNPFGIDDDDEQEKESYYEETIDMEQQEEGYQRYLDEQAAREDYLSDDESNRAEEEYERQQEAQAFWKERHYEDDFEK
ncbi:PIN-like domain-containing protein [Paenibacillus amylolyticus]|uniref:PIN-like domain-containing protein n=1 Tax=Paenibacillus amylolyticus TaxID=1451 RepID=UPI0033982E5C